MTQLTPIYTPDNCRAAYQLNWSLALFWRESPLPAAEWLERLKNVTRPDGVRILEHRVNDKGASQFLLSTTPIVSPASIVRSVKGRLQHAVRGQRPKAFHGNYSIRSIGNAKTDTIDRYVSQQTDHHQMADPFVQRRIERYQINRPDADLTTVLRSSHGEYQHNLHLVLVNADRDVEVCESILETVQRTIIAIAEKKGHLLSRGGILADHIHLTLGCRVTDVPVDVAMAYLNNLAYAQGMKWIYEFGYYVGTFGNYDLGAVRRP